MAQRDHDADGARLADALAAEFGREETPPSITGATGSPVPRPSRLPWVIAAASLAVLVVQIPSIHGALAARPSLHSGADVADAQACIDELWKISALVQQGASAETLARVPLTEPLTDARYAVTREGDTLIVACPNPALHGLTRLRITADAPMPEASL